MSALDLVAVLAEPNRRRLLELLAEGEAPVGQLASQFGVTRSAVSQHLGVLATAGLVQVRRDGRFRYYRLDPSGMARLRQALDLFWTNELEQLASAGAPPTGGQAVIAEKSVLVPLGAEETFALLTEPDRLRRWQAVAARIDLRAGGEYRWTITPGHSAAGTFSEVEPGRRLVFTWGWEDSAVLPPGTSTVTITLEPAEGGTTVRLVHEGLDDEQAAGHLEGWTHYLDRLTVAARRGDAGPDDWAANPPEPREPVGAAEAALAVCQDVLRQVAPAQMGASTPCTDFTVGQLVDHLVESVAFLGSVAGATATPGDGPPEQRVAHVAQPALEAWRHRGVDGTVSMGPMEMPAAMAASILPVEFLVHAWDVAQATGVPMSPSDELTAYVLELAETLIVPPLRAGRFDEAKPTGPDAQVLERLVAFTGRAA